MKSKAITNKLAFMSSTQSFQSRPQSYDEDPLIEGQRDSRHSRDITIGQLIGFENSLPKVEYPGNLIPSGLVARSCVQLSEAQLGREVLLAFERGDSNKPIIMGLLQPVRDSHASDVNVLIDGKRVLLTGEHEVVLRCGEASITLTRAGKILLRGTYVLSRSSGVNRIKGGTVQIN